MNANDHLAGLYPADLVIHNVRLDDVRKDEQGKAVLVVTYGGTQRQMPSGYQSGWIQERIGQFGYLVRAESHACLAEHAFWFRPYLDSSLRRIPELDCYERPLADGRQQNVVGWRCDTRPHGFRAPVGIVPGEDGGFIADDTVAVTVRVPPEFFRVGKGVGLEADELLRSFIGDLARISNAVSKPRADGYSSNGSDEREYASAWLHRAHGHHVVDLDALDAQEEAREDRAYLLDDIGTFFDDFKDAGGTEKEFFDALTDLIDKRANSQGEV